MVSTDRDALMAIYSSAGGYRWILPGWTHEDRWGTGAELSEWFGVDVNAEGRVVKLDLSNNNLKGPINIPKQLGALRELEELNLRGNNLVMVTAPFASRTGVESPGFLNFDAWYRAGFVDLTNPYGSVMGFIGGATERGPGMVCLCRTCPFHLGTLTKLKVLDLSANNLQGPLDPPENLRWAFSFIFGGSMPTPVNLEVLALSNNGFTGPIPKELGTLRRLRALELADNKLTGDIPEELGKLSTLVVLNLGGNELTGGIPVQLRVLTMLEALHLSSNGLVGYIPEELGALSRLRMLHLSNNQLEGFIPEGLAKLSALVVLNLGGNGLTGGIPAQLGDLTMLEILDLSSNKLTGPIPKELGTLRKLRTLELANNRLTDIPRDTAEMFVEISANTLINVSGNRWETPPLGVIQGGWEQVVRYYDELAQSGGVIVTGLKVVLVGAVHAGKTTLARGLLDGHVPQTPPPSTRGVDVHVHPWVPDFNPALDVMIWDFAGHDAYCSTHQLFLTDGALHLLVVDLHKFSQDPLSKRNTVYMWLDSLLCRVPGSAVLVVATRADAFSYNSERASTLESLEEAIKTHLERKKKQWLTAETIKNRQRASKRGSSNAGTSLERPSSPPPSLWLCGFISICGRSSDGLASLKKKICDVLQEPGTDNFTFPHLRQYVPNSWRRVWAVMNALHVGADLKQAARLEGPIVPLEGGEKLEFVKWKYAFEAWLEADNEWAKEVKNTKSSGRFNKQKEASQLFQDALSLLQVRGAALVACDLIHLNPSWINSLLREMLDHNLADPMKDTWWRGELEEYHREHGIVFNRLMKAHRKYVISGMLTVEYLGFLWRKVVTVADDEVFGSLVETLALHDVMFLFDDDGNKGRVGDLMVPARLQGSISEASLAMLKKAVSQGTRMQFVITVDAEYVPPAIISLFLGGFCRRENIVFRACWTRGLAFMMSGQECLVRLEEAGTGPRRAIEISIAGPYTKDVSEVGFRAKGSMEQLLEQYYPGLQFDASADPTEGRGEEAWQDSLKGLRGDLFEKLDLKVEAMLKRILESLRAESLGLDEALANRLSRLRSDMQLDMGCQLDATTQDIVLRVEEEVRDKLAPTSGAGMGGLSQTERRVLTCIARNVAFMRWPIPRLVCLLPAPDSGEPALTAEQRSFDHWSDALQQWCLSKKAKGRRLATRKLCLFFLCSQDYSLAVCGPGGQGYEVSELLNWAKKAKPAAKVGLAVVSIALKVCTGLAIPRMDFDAAFGATTGDVVAQVVEEAATSSIDSMMSAAGGRIESGGRTERLKHAGVNARAMEKVRPLPLEGFEYDQLKEVVKSFEVNGTPKGNSPFPSFDTAMQLQDRGGDALEWAWVSNGNVDDFVTPLR